MRRCPGLPMPTLWYGLRVSSEEFREPPREYAMGGVPAVNRDGRRVDVEIAARADGSSGNQRRVTASNLAPDVDSRPVNATATNSHALVG